MLACTLYDKLWNAHTVRVYDDGTTLLYIDTHFIHEVTSPQAFGILSGGGLDVHDGRAIVATPDHNVPTDVSRRRSMYPCGQVASLLSHCSLHCIRCSPVHGGRQGIVHVAGPEQGATLPAGSVACGDSHTSTHGALGALSQGIGTSDVANVLLAQAMRQKRNRGLLISLEGQLRPGCYAKDVALHVAARIGAGGGAGYCMELWGSAMERVTLEGRMSLCNMSIEAGARFSLTRADNAALNYMHARRPSHGRLAYGAEVRDTATDALARHSRMVTLRADSIEPQITWGTTPYMSTSVRGCVPDPAAIHTPRDKSEVEAALDYMSLEPGMPLACLGVDFVFIGSCTNARSEDIRAAAHVVRLMKGRVHRRIRGAIVVPGSMASKAQLEMEGVDDILTRAGFEWREPGCSMCIAMNRDQLTSRERCVSTSNRSFEGRQGPMSRTHLASPATAALAAMTGYVCDASALAWS
ncbi:3-isopropylmalate dehydratase large subunit [Candidatus Tremblaya princeps]|uniref:3-isopropylmalate dehydratase n=1 Tax=Tremblaya princeps TaxID=189385 RepID=A0A143WNI1_TREPR|nr:3-isopropylmalate dehydratase large subunit [Candidatus Tremblaya princeps]